MLPFAVGHATHSQWSEAFELVAKQLDAQLADRADAPTLGWVYFTDAYAAAAETLFDALRRRWPGVAFVGTVGVGVCASGVEYFDEPALVVMLAALPREQFQLFSGTAGLRSARGVAAPRAVTALVHADPATPDLSELIAELAERTETGYLFGGLLASRRRHVQIANGVFEGGLSGVAFGETIGVVSRVSQGCTPVGPTRRVTASDGTVVLALDGRPALPQLLADLRLPGAGADAAPMSARVLRDALPRLRRTLVGLTEPPARGVGGARRVVAGSRAAARRSSFGEEVRVRHLIGLDPARQGIAVAEGVHPGIDLTFCERDVAAARRDLVRMCTEVRDEIETRLEARRPATPAAALPGAAPLAASSAGAGGAPGRAPAEPGMLGAVFVSCAGRGGPHFGAPSAELQIVRHALGDVPLAGFFAAGEVAHRQLHGYTAVLTVFTDA